MNPRSTDCEADALTTTPSRRSFRKKEQPRIVLRYTRDDKVNESFTGFVEISSVSAESISAAILQDRR